MEYQATARSNGATYTGHIAGSDHAAVLSVVGMLPANHIDNDTALIVEHVYANRNSISYVTTLAKYLAATE